jgi:pyrroline-5-carboxylate reductase
VLPGPLWLVGCGNMAGPSGASVGHGIRVSTAYPDDQVPALVMLGMKPYQLDAVAPELAPILDPDTILISILAGVELATLRERFAAPSTIVKAMPNLPVRLGKGVTGLYSDSSDLTARALVTALMAELGHAEWFDDEGLFRVAGHLTGAGPAFLFRFLEALAGAGQALGIPEEQAARLAAAMVEGSAALAATSDESPRRLAERVASPRGTTQAGLDVLDQAGGLADLLRRTLEATQRRSLEMAAEARGGRS